MMDRRQFLQTLAAIGVAAGETSTGVLAQPLAATLKDYAFAPGITSFDRNAYFELAVRPNTCLIDESDTPAISRLIDVINNDLGAIVNCGPDDPQWPATGIRQLILVTHANNHGTMMVALDPADYALKSVGMEELDRVIGTHSIELSPLATLDGVGITSSNTVFRIFGCRIGAVRPFMEKLKQALGGRIPVIAPNHIHWVVWNPKLLRGGADCLQYHFEFTTLGNPTRKEVLDAFKAQASAAFSALATPGSTADVDFAYKTWKQLIGGPIPDSDWENWIPQFPAPRRKAMPPSTFFKQPIIGLTHPPPLELAEFRYGVDIAGPFLCPGGAAKATAGPDVRRDFVKASLSGDVRFDPARTTYPYYLRHGAKTTDEFISAFQWWPQGFAPAELKKTMKQDPNRWWGRRMSYSVRRPICDADNSLIYNYVGEDGSWQNHLDRCLTDPSRAAVKSLLFTTV